MVTIMMHPENSQVDKIAILRMRQRGLKASKNLSELIALLLQDSPDKSAAVFFSGKNPPSNISSYSAIYRYQAPVLTTEVDENEFNMIPKNASTLPFNEANASYTNFRSLKLDAKYIYMEGKIHKKEDNREPEFISAVKEFIAKGENDANFKAMHPKVFLAINIIPNVNTILTNQQFKIPNLLGKGELNSDTFKELQTYYNEAIHAYKNITDVLDALIENKFLSKSEKDSLIGLSAMMKDEKNQFDRFVCDNVHPDKLIELVNNQLNILNDSKDQLAKQIKIIKNNTETNYGKSKENISNTLQQISNIQDDIQKAAPLIDAMSKNTDKKIEKHYQKQCAMAKKFLYETNKVNNDLIKIVIKLIKNPENATQEKDLFKLMISCAKMKNYEGAKFLLDQKEISSMMVKIELRQYVTSIDLEILSKIPDCQPAKELHKALTEKLNVQHTSTASMLTNLSRSEATPLSPPMTSPTPTSATSTAVSTPTHKTTSQQAITEQTIPKVSPSSPSPTPTRKGSRM